MGSKENGIRSIQVHVHVLALPFPAQGHVSPMMHLSKRLAAERGITVSFVNVDSIHEQMMKHWTAPHGLNLRLDSIPFSWKTPNGFDANCLANRGKWLSQAEQELAPALTELISRLKSSEFGPVSCIISDFFLPWSQDVADKFGIPRVILWSGNAAWTSFEHHIPELLSHGHIFPAKGRVPLDEAKSIVVDYVRGLAPLPLSDVPDYMLCGMDKEFVDLSIKRPSYVKRASWVLVNSFYELEKPAFDFMVSELGPKLVPAGPMFLLDEAESGPSNVVLRSESKECLNWLDQQQPSSVLYISFGSIAVLTTDQFLELAAAVEQSGKPFVWVIKPELVVGGGAEELYRGFCERMGKQGFVVSWAPQLSVLAHPSVGGFLTHCGWNSILESICNGVPMICWPYGAEQNTNAKLVVEDWMIGVRFSLTALQGLIKRSEIEAAINKVMCDAEMKERAQALKKLGRRAMAKDAGQSFKNLAAFLADLQSVY